MVLTIINIMVNMTALALYMDSIEKFDQMLLILLHAVADPGFGKGGFMRMSTVATTPPYDVHAHRCNESGCCL